MPGLHPSDNSSTLLHPTHAWTASSIGQSDGLIIRRFQVQVLGALFAPESLGGFHALAPPAAPVDERNAQETKERLREIFQQYPPSVSQVLRLDPSIATLAKELLEIEATGDRNRAEQWFKKYDSMPAELKSALTSVKDVPVDVDPVNAFGEQIQ